MRSQPDTNSVRDNIENGQASMALDLDADHSFSTSRKRRGVHPVVANHRAFKVDVHCTRLLHGLLDLLSGPAAGSHRDDHILAHQVHRSMPVASVLGKGVLPRAALLFGVLVPASLTIQPAEAANQCIVQDAADAAVQRQIALIDAAKVDPASFFAGPNSCINADLLKQFDLSNLIPDLAGWLTSAVTDAISNAITAAQQQVCNVMNEQLQNAVSAINSQMSAFQGTLTSPLNAALGGTPLQVSLPALPQIGQYSGSGTAAPSSLPSILLPQSTPSYSATPDAPSPTASTAPSTAPAEDYSTIFK